MDSDVIIIKDPEVAKLFADDTRRQILHKLRHHELSTTDLAKALDKSHSSILHHLKLLHDAGLIEETRTEKKRNLVQSFYRSKASRFIISYSLSETLESPEISTWRREMLHKILGELDSFGAVVPAEEKDRVLELLDALFLREQKAMEESVERETKAVKIERPVYWAIIRLLTNLRLHRDLEYRKLVDKLNGILKIDQSGR